MTRSAQLLLAVIILIVIVIIIRCRAKRRRHANARRAAEALMEIIDRVRDEMSFAHEKMPNPELAYMGRALSGLSKQRGAVCASPDNMHAYYNALRDNGESYRQCIEGCVAYPGVRGELRRMVQSIHRLGAALGCE